MPEPCFISSPDKEEIQNSRAEDLKPSCSCLHSGPACVRVGRKTNLYAGMNNRVLSCDVELPWG